MYNVEVVYTAKEGLHLNTVEKFYVYRETKNTDKLSDQGTVLPNISSRLYSSIFI
jgi:hypothetical protein